VRLRCTQCSSVFRVKAPHETVPTAVPQAAPVAVPEVPVPDLPPLPSQPDRDPARLVLVAHSDDELRKQVMQAVESWGLQAIGAQDGVEAILETQRHLPRAVLLDAALPKMYGFQVCELIKRNDSLRAIQVVLVGAIYDDTRYRRTPDQLYGADVYLETPDLPDGLHPALRDFGLPLSGDIPRQPFEPAPTTHRGVGGIDAAAALEAAEPPEEAETPMAAAPSLEQEPPAPLPAAPSLEQEPPAPLPAPVVEPPTPLDAAPQAPAMPAAGADDGVAKAERLARIIVSDVILYNEEKFAAALASGSVIEMMEPDLQEGRSLFQQRIDPSIAGQKDFLREELLRVARQRGMS
jgi:CheY-like chemotaxis protein